MGMGMGRASPYGQQGSFFGRRPPPMNQRQAPFGGGFLAQLGSSPMMQRPMPGGPGKGRSRGRPMTGGPGKGRGQMQQPSGGFFLGNMLNNAISQGQMGQPQPFGQVGNNPPPPPPQLEMVGNNPVGRPMPQPFGQLSQPFGQLRTQGPMNMPTLRTEVGPGMPQSPSMGQQGQIFQGLSSFGQPVRQGGFTQGPMNMPQPARIMDQGPRPIMNRSAMHLAPQFTSNPRYSRGFYGGGIMDLYPR